MRGGNGNERSWANCRTVSNCSAYYRCCNKCRDFAYRNLGSQENIAKAKGELIESLPDKGIAILNEDDPYVIRMGDTFSGNIIGYGVNGNYTVHGSRIQYENNCTKYVCTCFDEAFKVKLNMLGIHNVYNALAATATARVLGIDVNRIQKHFLSFYLERKDSFSQRLMA